MEQVPGQKRTIADILQFHLEPAARPEFKEWSDGVSDNDFREGLNVFFTAGEIQSALAEYAIEKLTEIELYAGIRIDAVVTVDGTEFGYRSYNEVAHI